MFKKKLGEISTLYFQNNQTFFRWGFSKVSLKILVSFFREKSRYNPLAYEDISIIFWWWSIFFTVDWMTLINSRVCLVTLDLFLLFRIVSKALWLVAQWVKNRKIVLQIINVCMIGCTITSSLSWQKFQD